MHNAFNQLLHVILFDSLQKVYQPSKIKTYHCSIAHILRAQRFSYLILISTIPSMLNNRCWFNKARKEGREGERKKRRKEWIDDTGAVQFFIFENI
jgi:hypothetical protein